MEKNVTERIKQLVSEIDALVNAKHDLQRKLKHIDEEMIRKSGAIHELKRLLDELNEPSEPNQPDQEVSE